MSDRNLAASFGPNILQSKEDNPETLFGETALVQRQPTSKAFTSERKVGSFLHQRPSSTPLAQVAARLQTVPTVSDRESRSANGGRSRSTGAEKVPLRPGPEPPIPVSSLRGKFPFQLHAEGKSANRPSLNRPGVQTSLACEEEEEEEEISKEEEEGTGRRGEKDHNQLSVPTRPNCQISPGGHSEPLCSSGNACLEEGSGERSSSELGVGTETCAGDGEDKASVASFGDPGEWALRGRAAALNRKLINQKLDYETSLRGLEKRRQELELEVQNVQLNLSQQRICYDLSEIKLRNVQQARGDAEKQNDKLQMEMEQFFDTFGDLTTQ